MGLHGMTVFALGQMRLRELPPGRWTTFFQQSWTGWKCWLPKDDLDTYWMTISSACIFFALSFLAGDVDADAL
jgi:hypothetical protein